jgi:hypothetical protein
MLVSRSWWVTEQLRKLGESLMPVATAIAEVTTTEWVKTTRRTEREANLGGGGVESSAATTVLSSDQEAPPVDPAPRRLPPILSANADRVPEWKAFIE